MKIVLDTGALTAIDRRDHHVRRLIDRARTRGLTILTSSGCVSQAWRNGARQANLARTLRGVTEVGLDETVSREVGVLCGMTSTSDVVDAHVALLVATGDVLLTSDLEDLKLLCDSLRVHPLIESC